MASQPGSSPAIGPDQSGMVGTVLYNYAFVMTVPSWLNERRRNVSVDVSLWASTALSTVTYILIGLLGALSYSFASGDDLLTLFLDNTRTFFMTKTLGVYQG